MSDFDSIVSDFCDGTGDDRRLTAPENWGQGRTLYGGMSGALCYLAAKQHVDDAFPVRSALFNFVGPSGGELVGQSEVLRMGRSAAIVEAILSTADGVGTKASFAFGKVRESKIAQSRLAAPDVAAPEDCLSLWNEAGERPGFTVNFDYRKAGGSQPRSGSETPELLAWVRHRQPVRTDQTAGLIALADSLPPAIVTAFEQPAPISTMTWGIDFLTHDIQVQKNWFLLQSIAEATENGYSSQIMNVWDRDGRPIMAARQTIAIYY